MIKYVYYIMRSILTVNLLKVFWHFHMKSESGIELMTEPLYCSLDVSWARGCTNKVCHYTEPTITMLAVLV